MSSVHRLLDRVSPVRKWLGVGLDLVFPPACCYCHTQLESSADGLLCLACREELVDNRATCPRCGSGGLPNQASGTCLHCHDEKLYFDSVVRLGRYEGTLRTAVLRIKSQRHRALAIALGDLLASARCERLLSLEAEAIVPIPMHWSRRLWRGANSREVLGERLASRLQLPLAAHLLARSRRTAPQASLPPTRRLANVRGAFRAGTHPELPGARLLLVDDIMTTGATVNEAAKTLTRAGAKVVAIIVLARAEGLG